MIRSLSLLCCLFVCCFDAFAQDKGKQEDHFQEDQSEVVHHPSENASAQAWKSVVISLVRQQEWNKLQMIAPLGKKVFSTTDIWRDQQFLSAWNAWLAQSSKLSWALDDDRKGMWRQSEGKNINRPSIGIRKEQNGTWWMVVVDPAHKGWHCPANGCVVVVDTGVRKLSLNAKPPIGSKWDDAQAIGMMLPINDLKDQEQYWNVRLPGAGEDVVFDMSYARRTCQTKMMDCF